MNGIPRFLAAAICGVLFTTAAIAVDFAPGTVLSVQSQAVAAPLTHAGERFLITYRSRGIRGEPIVASGFVLLPNSRAPWQGWPVLAWAHGTTGVADTCAPSADFPNGPVHDYQQVADVALDAWLARGYAVVAPDYEGLGTPGGHPYMDAASQLHTLVDAVRALHRLRPGALSRDWLVMGHSQGGAAALQVAAHGQAELPQMRLRGAIALAPGGYDYAGIARYAREHPQLPPAVAAFVPIVLLGAQAANPGIDLTALIDPALHPLLDKARSRCLSELQQEIRGSPAGVFRRGVDLQPLLAYLDRQDIRRMVPAVPLLLVQGEADQLVDARGTAAYVHQLCAAGNRNVFLRPIAGGSHRDALSQSPALTADFVAQLDGKDRLPACAAAAR
ncbi:MAG: alpha/beta fold hydrolase [Steroidobacteraceae bacterium]